MRRALVAAIAALAVALAGSPASAQQTAAPGPGSPGLGDDYYPDYGNGGYDVGHYDIRLRYWPDTDKLAAYNTIHTTLVREESGMPKCRSSPLTDRLST